MAAFFKQDYKVEQRYLELEVSAMSVKVAETEALLAIENVQPSRAFLESHYQDKAILEYAKTRLLVVKEKLEQAERKVPDLAPLEEAWRVFIFNHETGQSTSR